jgi:hypothetical protein
MDSDVLIDGLIKKIKKYHDDRHRQTTEQKHPKPFLVVDTTMTKPVVASSPRRRQQDGMQANGWSVQCGALVILAALVFQLWTISRNGDNRATTTRNEIASSPPHPRNNDLVILLGIPGSGSLALHDYFTCHGKSSSHYCCGGGGGDGTTKETNQNRTHFPCPDDKTCGDCVLTNLKAHRPAFFGCGGEAQQQQEQVWSQFDVETADAWFLPQHFALGLLHEAYPNATWILNTRGTPQDWAASVFHWHSKTRRFLTSYGLDLYPNPVPSPPDPKAKVTADEIEQDMQQALEQRVDNRTEQLRKLTLLERIYLNHTATVKLWARQFPSHRLIEINVDDDASLTTLDEAFGYSSIGGGGSKCEWNFEALDDDWKGFSLPF